MYDRDDSAPPLLSFLIGGMIGATLTCLLAPQAGVALRRRLRAGLGGGARKARTITRRVAAAGVPEPALPTVPAGSERG